MISALLGDHSTMTAVEEFVNLQISGVMASGHCMESLIKWEKSKSTHPYQWG